MDSKTDPVIKDLIQWLHQNLPPGYDDEKLFRKVKRVQKVFDILIGLSFEEFYKCALSLKTNTQAENENENEDRETSSSLDDEINERLKNMKEYLNLNHEKQMKTNKLNLSRSKLDIKKEQYQLITSIRLNNCLDLISRYNHLISKK